jgi:hypothetical protein
MFQKLLSEARVFVRSGSTLVRILENIGYGPFRMEEFAFHHSVDDDVVRQSSLIVTG